ncbi:hypothetical protein KIN20_001553 [Parelaphostrongylus tenuis]|uniref:Uncharacterized protein n=1 Tax=Parelaphostrongylus tenuis TaxID=148309 RepID=A0AAD5LYH9_PARTN|nr:hypothetical protein KIN20_001553 [Parelaphostrongylus tenuis]
MSHGIVVDKDDENASSPTENELIPFVHDFVCRNGSEALEGVRHELLLSSAFGADTPSSDSKLLASGMVNSICGLLIQIHQQLSIDASSSLFFLKHLLANVDFL